MNNQDHEILSITQEECSEVIQAISKIFRFGIDTEWQGETNREHLEEEIGDLQAMINLLIEHKVVDIKNVENATIKKTLKLKKWSSISITNDK